jgi:hypothetical protein
MTSIERTVKISINNISLQSITNFSTDYQKDYNSYWHLYLLLLKKMPLLLNFLGSGDFLNEDDGFVPNECGITETLSMVGILERIPISIFNDNNSTSVNGLLPSTSIWTSA